MLSHKERMNSNVTTEEVIKIKKRGCSPASSSSSVVNHNNRTKRAIVAAKRGTVSTPLSTWRTIRTRSPAISVVRVDGVRTPKNEGKLGMEQPVSARKLAAMLWGVNEVRPMAFEGKRRGGRWRDDSEKTLRSHLSDHCHSPFSERLQRPRTGHLRQESTTSAWPIINDHNMMEIETRSRCRTPTGSMTSLTTRLKDASNALTTSKELLRIISRIWGHESRPISTTSIISALHTELERARMQVNQLMREDHSDENEISYVLKRLEEEKAAWKIREREKVEAAIKSITEELEAERKLRRRLERLNKKLGGELAEMKASFFKASEELERERRAREYVELVFDELSNNIGLDKAKLGEAKRESARIHDEVEEEREMLRIANAIREERAQTKLSDAKHHFEGKNAAIDKLIENFLQEKQETQQFMDRRMDGDLVRPSFGFRRSDQEADKVETDAEIITDGDLIELNKDDFNKKSNPTSRSVLHRNSADQWKQEEFKGQRSTTGKASRRSTSLSRTCTDIVQLDSISNNEQAFGKKLQQRRSCGDEISRYRSIKSLRDHILSSPKHTDEKDQSGQTRTPRDLSSGSRSRLDESLLEGESGRTRSRWSVHSMRFG
ncbi:hypothetical protein Droror1_Dr00008954 [Drosera rotundifolia]